MQEFTITTQLILKEYVKAMFIGLYKKPVYIFSTILGIYLLTTVLLNYFQFIDFYQNTPWFEIICGSILFFSPAIIVLIAVKQVLSIPNLKHEIKYTFNENEIIVEGHTFKTEFQWSHFYKYKDLSIFLILYHNKNSGYFLDKNKLTPAQLTYIKEKVGTK